MAVLANGALKDFSGQILLRDVLHLVEVARSAKICATAKKLIEEYIQPRMLTYRAKSL